MQISTLIKDIYKSYEKLSSKFNEFYIFPKHSHMDLLMSNDRKKLLFPKINKFMIEVSIMEKIIL
jgi:hypothetical protein